MSKKTETTPADIPPVADDEQKRIAMAHAMLENQRRKRESECGAELDKAIREILAKYKCKGSFMQLSENGNVTRIWIQPVAQDESQAQG